MKGLRKTGAPTAEGASAAGESEGGAGEKPEHRRAGKKSRAE